MQDQRLSASVGGLSFIVGFGQNLFVDLKFLDQGLNLSHRNPGSWPFPSYWSVLKIWLASAFFRLWINPENESVSG
jgi:hypothetical protein